MNRDINDLMQLRGALFEAARLKDELVAHARGAVERLQEKTLQHAKAQVRAMANCTEKTSAGKKLEIEAAMAEHNADLEVAKLEVKLASIQIGCWETQVSALQTEAKTFDTEARLGGFG